MRKYLKEGKYSYNPAELLGEGSFGKVYKGFNQITQQEVALKQILLSKLHKQGDEMLKTILLSEISVMRKFNRNMQKQPCPFLVRQEDVFRTDKHIFIVMEICSGGTLEDQMRDQLLKQKHCVQILFCIAKGLQYMDEMGIVHRDLKPQNIFISSVKLGQGQGKDMKVYKIGDFGFAAQKKQFDLAMGTMPYMAPEMFKKQKYNSKVDVWSLGIIGYQILYGGLYFIGKNSFQIQKNIKQKPFILNQREQGMSSRNYQDFLNRCLNKDPGFRIPVNQLLNHPLFSQIKKQIKQIQSTIYAQIKQNAMQSQMNVSKKAQQNKQQLKVFLQTQVHQKSEEAQNTSNIVSTDKKEEVSMPNNLIAFIKIQMLLQQCQKMRKIAQQFQSLEENSPRMTQFIQIYLLKDALVFMNRLTYSVTYKQNHIQFQEKQFEQILKSENSQKLNQICQKCVKECNWVTGLFNQKYKWFMNQYITKFHKDDIELIRIVVNEQPYEQINTQIFQKQLRKWENVFINDEESGHKNYGKWKQLCKECRRMLDLRLKG